MTQQICPECGHVVFAHELYCPVCSGNDVCQDVVGDGGSGDDDFSDLVSDPDQLLSF